MLLRQISKPANGHLIVLPELPRFDAGDDTDSDSEMSDDGAAGNCIVANVKHVMNKHSELCDQAARRYGTQVQQPSLDPDTEEKLAK